MRERGGHPEEESRHKHRDPTVLLNDQRASVGQIPETVGILELKEALCSYTVSPLKNFIFCLLLLKMLK